jgi:hypothetical protein
VTNRVCDKLGDAYASESGDCSPGPSLGNQWAHAEPQRACRMPNSYVVVLTEANCAKAGGDIIVP